MTVNKCIVKSLRCKVRCKGIDVDRYYRLIVGVVVWEKFGDLQTKDQVTFRKKDLNDIC